MLRVSYSQRGGWETFQSRPMRCVGFFGFDPTVRMHRFSWGTGPGALLCALDPFFPIVPFSRPPFSSFDRLPRRGPTREGLQPVPPFSSFFGFRSDPVWFPNRTRTIPLSSTSVDPGRPGTCFLYFVVWVVDATKPPPQVSCKQSTTCTCACCFAFVDRTVVPLHLRKGLLRSGHDRWIHRYEHRSVRALVGDQGKKVQAWDKETNGGT